MSHRRGGRSWLGSQICDISKTNRKEARPRVARPKHDHDCPKDYEMSSLTQINVAPDLFFDALVAGEPAAPLVLLLHGFAESMNCWQAQVAALADMGYRAIAPSQRGYSKGARPDPRDASHYHIDRLIDDAMAIVAASG